MPNKQIQAPIGLDITSPLAQQDVDSSEHRSITIPGGSQENRQPAGLHQLQKIAARGGGSKRATKTINITTTFPNPWKKTADEIAAIRGNRWAPSSDDFDAIAGSSYTVNHFYQLLGVIIKQPQGSIKRINIFTHSNPDLITFKGTIKPKSTFAEVLLETSSALSLQMLEQITAQTWFQVGKSKKKYYMKDIRKRFGKNAKVYFYSCKSATDVQLLQEFADKFQVMAAGFKKNICFCPIISTNSITRKRIGLGLKCQHKGTNFKAMDSEAVLRKP